MPQVVDFFLKECGRRDRQSMSEWSSERQQRNNGTRKLVTTATPDSRRTVKAMRGLTFDSSKGMVEDIESRKWSTHKTLYRPVSKRAPCFKRVETVAPLPFPRPRPSLPIRRFYSNSLILAQATPAIVNVRTLIRARATFCMWHWRPFTPSPMTSVILREQSVEITDAGR